jgi:small subunit ribosomal protein S3Ae
MDGIFNATTRDQYSTRISVVAFTRDRINASQEHGVRQVMSQIVEEKASTLNYDQLAQEVVLGKLGSDIYNLAKKIAPLRHVGVRKSKLLSIPEGVMATPAQLMEQAKAAESAGSVTATT